MRILRVAAVALLALLACEEEAAPPDGGAAADAAPHPDAAPGADAAPLDAGAADALVTDAGPVDSGLMATGLGAPVVFVSRQLNDQGSVYWDVPADMAGVGARSRVRPASPGKLLVLEPDGTLRTLIDGSAPTAASGFLIDVNAPAVSYAGNLITFAGLTQGPWSREPATSLGGWRIYLIRPDGTGLTQLTRSDEDNLDLSRHGAAAGGLVGYDDYDPVFLPDGRICFSSTRYRAFGQYSGVRASNLYVMNVDGTRRVRITAERNGADRPLVDPRTGKIVYARWWRNHRFPVHGMETVLFDPSMYPFEGYEQHLGLTIDRAAPVGGPTMFRNAWQIAAINPDGRDLAMWSGVLRDEEANHFYGGAFDGDGRLVANYFPMYNMTEAAGFGGLRRYTRGPARYEPLFGVTTLSNDYVHPANPTSYGIFPGPYAGEPEVLADGRILHSRAADVRQDYGLWVMGADGRDGRLVLDLPGTAELRARSLAERPSPPVLPDLFRDDPAAPAPAALAPLAAGPYDGDGVFIFDALNIYANAPVDSDIVSAPAVGSAATIRFFVDHQRTSPGSFPMLDWPVLLGEVPVAPSGAVREPNAPASVSLFEQLRGPQPGYLVPLTGGSFPDGAGHVAGLNFGVRGAHARCLGCHAGHTQMVVPPIDEIARRSNLAPGAQVSASSSREPEGWRGLIDRRVQKGGPAPYWSSAAGQAAGEWIRLRFLVPVAVRTVRLWAPALGGAGSSTLVIAQATVRLYAGGSLTPAASGVASNLSATGTDVSFADVRAEEVEVVFDRLSGRFYGEEVAALAEIEVIAEGLAP